MFSLNLSLQMGCAVKFVYIFPQNVEDQRRWIGELIRSFEVANIDINAEFA